MTINKSAIAVQGEGVKGQKAIAFLMDNRQLTMDNYQPKFLRQ
ncbi:hypothetical protein VL20_2825 [Microcystis panniformis FACHB-1757]|uniref:Uncharacterized protein n=1 Tax=Microcystis panniformis FACHB-1757 TaxID=1638788 RepID=A0A0K1S1M4_9CHRO|nr:hypothetical protein VL20_2825 [Microcystis panniformis FACHB-1757]